MHANKRFNQLIISSITVTFRLPVHFAGFAPRRLPFRYLQNLPVLVYFAKNKSRLHFSSHKNNKTFTFHSKLVDRTPGFVTRQSSNFVPRLPSFPLINSSGEGGGGQSLIPLHLKALSHGDLNSVNDKANKSC